MSFFRQKRPRDARRVVRSGAMSDRNCSAMLQEVGMDAKKIGFYNKQFPGLKDALPQLELIGGHDFFLRFGWIVVRPFTPEFLGWPVANEDRFFQCFSVYSLGGNGLVQGRIATERYAVWRNTLSREVNTTPTVRRLIVEHDPDFLMVLVTTGLNEPTIEGFRRRMPNQGLILVRPPKGQRLKEFVETVSE